MLPYVITLIVLIIVSLRKSGRISPLRPSVSPTSARNADLIMKKSRPLCGLLFFPTHLSP